MHRALLTLTLLTTATLTAQTSITPPIPPLITQYRYWPEQYVQFLTDPTLPYTLLALNVDPKTSHYELSLTDTSGKRTHYTNDESTAAIERTNHEACYVTKILFERADPAKEATSSLRLVLHDGTPLQWRFIQGSDVMQQGGGLTALPTVPVPVLAYREQSAVAGDGTALVLGKQVVQAELWTEISKPPYFIAYRGAYSTGVTTLVFAAGKQDWKIDSAPASLSNGATWKLSSEGRTETLTVTKLEGQRATIAEEDSLAPDIHQTLTATLTPAGWHFESLQFTPPDGEKHTATIQLTGNNLEVLLGKKNKIATATVDLTSTTSALTMKSPDWARGKSVQTTETVTPDSLTLAAQPSR